MIQIVVQREFVIARGNIKFQLEDRQVTRFTDPFAADKADHDRNAVMGERVVRLRTGRRKTVCLESVRARRITAEIGVELARLNERAVFQIGFIDRLKTFVRFRTATAGLEVRTVIFYRDDDVGRIGITVVINNLRAEIQNDLIVWIIGVRVIKTLELGIGVIAIGRVKR